MFNPVKSGNSKIIKTGTLSLNKDSKLQNLSSKNIDPDYKIASFLNWKQYSKILALIASFGVLAYLISVTNQFNFNAILGISVSSNKDVNNQDDSSIRQEIPILVKILYWILILFIFILVLLIILLVYLLVIDIKRDKLVI